MGRVLWLAFQLHSIRLFYRHNRQKCSFNQMMFKSLVCCVSAVVDWANMQLITPIGHNIAKLWYCRLWNFVKEVQLLRELTCCSYLAYVLLYSLEYLVWFFLCELVGTPNHQVLGLPTGKILLFSSLWCPTLSFSEKLSNELLHAFVKYLISYFYPWKTLNFESGNSSMTTLIFLLIFSYRYYSRDHTRGGFSCFNVSYWWPCLAQ